ncbi:MAG: gfo/Idh/MocA family oxidoreductase [Alphaproteobacteria bacterium]|nr:gfo/Idh/MocA family oxidoreductase [Alphaproteobacteria bacterium]
MRIVIIGLGIQGMKRLKIADGEVVATVDPVSATADYRDISDVPAEMYDAALVCTPDGAKIDVLTSLLGAGKHVLVEKPLLATKTQEIEALAALSATNNAVCYTAYNHRFEPHFRRMKDLLASGVLGKIYRCRLFYGNGTATDVRSSSWRDKGAGVLPDLGSHLLDTTLYWFGRPNSAFRVISCDRFENAAFDHVVIGGDGDPALELEMTLLSWRNTFTCDVLAENGSAHIRSLCKWGPVDFTVRMRKLPSGRPDEDVETLIQPDPTWALEYEHFKRLCRDGGGNLENDIWINETLNTLTTQAMRRSEAAA